MTRYFSYASLENMLLILILLIVCVLIILREVWLWNKKLRITAYAGPAVIILGFAILSVFTESIPGEGRIERQARSEKYENLYRPQIEELKEKRRQYDKNSEEYGQLTDKILELYYHGHYHNGVYSILNNSHDGPVYLEAGKLLDQDLKDNVPAARERIQTLQESFQVSQDRYIPE